MPADTRTKGLRAEELACQYLKQHGLTLLARNYRGHHGEIDLIMRDGKVTVFIEVRSRRSSDYMDAAESIGAGKRAHIVATSQDYLQRLGRADKDICRFDVVLLAGSDGAVRIDWLKNAFET